MLPEPYMRIWVRMFARSTSPLLRLLELQHPTWTYQH